MRTGLDGGVLFSRFLTDSFDHSKVSAIICVRAGIFGSFAIRNRDDEIRNRLDYSLFLSKTPSQTTSRPTFYFRTTVFAQPSGQSNIDWLPFVS